MEKALLNEYFQNNWPEMQKDYIKFLSFKSISTDPAYNNDCNDCALWLENEFKQLNFKTELVKTPTKPLLLAKYQVAHNAPHIVFYGHYDVQPVDPLELWNSKPFEPIVKDGKIYARGAQDNKGQVFFVLKAIEALVKNNALNVNLTVLIEGEEECGSSGIKSVLANISEKITGDLLMVCDTGMRNSDTPAITMGLRGIIALEVILEGAKKDLHSGIHGGICKNPAMELTKLVAGLTDSNGKITIPNYYENVRSVMPRELKEIEKLKFNTNNYQEEIGVMPNGGEVGLDPMVRNGFRPTIEVNGIYGGYQGDGGKTIIPSRAGVKLSSRLVGGQDPENCMRLLKNYFTENAPEGLRLKFGHEEVGGPAVLLNPEANCVKLAEKVLADIFSNPADLIWEGASIPIVSSLAKYTNEQALLVGFGLEEDNIHAPNESFAIERMKKGFMYVSQILQQLSNL